MRRSSRCRRVGVRPEVVGVIGGGAIFLDLGRVEGGHFEHGRGGAVFVLFAAGGAEVAGRDIARFPDVEADWAAGVGHPVRGVEGGGAFFGIIGSGGFVEGLVFAFEDVEGQDGAVVDEVGVADAHVFRIGPDVVVV